MSLVEHLNISLKDFLPHSRARLITSDGNPMAVISERLYQEMQAYGEKNNMCVRSVLEKLRAEIHKVA